ncbi:MAG: ADP-ribosylglycohydrolase family protein [Planctomycetota bacterium]
MRPQRHDDGGALRRSATAVAIGLVGVVAWAGAARAELVIDRTEYADRMVGFWLAQSIANWTGLQTENRRATAPFYTDGNWADPAPDDDPPFDTLRADFVFNSPVWKADDDTDIEYVYLHLLDQHATHRLSPEQIRAGWRSHINRFIWVSNQEARNRMGQGVSPRVSGMQQANPFGPRIDAQLTTEVFGALAPGMPAAALENGLTPMMATSRTHATHAAQYFALLHSLEPAAPETLTDVGERLRWASDHARAYLPDTSKAADIVDFVTDHYEQHTAGGTVNLDDWETTRDAIYQRYQVDAAANGFRYRGPTESSVNLATGVMTLLYGGGDLQRSIQIGTLSGWDSDNPTATIAALIGQVLGEQGVRDAFPEQDLSLLYDISRTRDRLPDYVPGDDAEPGDAEDTFTLMAQRMLGVIDRTVAAGGGQVDPANNRWVIPAVDFSDPLKDSATHRLQSTSANLAAVIAGEAPQVTTDGVATADAWFLEPRFVADGLELDFRGLDPGSDQARGHQLRAADGQAEFTLTVEYPDAVDLVGLRFMEGDHPDDGGWFEGLAFQVLRDGQWIDLSADTTPSEALDAERAFQWIDYDFGRVVDGVEAIRLSGLPGGGDSETGVAPWASLAEFDGILHTDASPYFLDGDYDGDGHVSQADLDLVLLNWGAAVLPTAWRAGHQFDGTLIGQAELDRVLLNWGSGQPPTAVLVPEPAVAAWVAVLLTAAGRRRGYTPPLTPSDQP